MRDESLGSDLPVEIVVQNLNRRGPRSPGNVLRDCDEDRRIWFPDKKALFSLPLKHVSVSKEVSYTGRETRKGIVHRLFPGEAPPEDQRTSRFELYNLSGVVKLDCLVLA